MVPSLGTQVHAEKPSGGPPGQPAFVADEVVISFQPGVTVSSINKFYASTTWSRSSAWALAVMAGHTPAWSK